MNPLSIAAQLAPMIQPEPRRHPTPFTIAAQLAAITARPSRSSAASRYLEPRRQVGRTMRAVLDLLADDAEWECKKIAEAIGSTPDNCRKTIEVLRNYGLIRKARVVRRGMTCVPFYVRIPDATV